MRFKRPLYLSATISLAACGGDATSVSTAAAVTLEPSAALISGLGERQEFTVIVLDAAGEPVEGASINWSVVSASESRRR